jgi:hypothetical protein
MLSGSLAVHVLLLIGISRATFSYMQMRDPSLCLYTSGVLQLLAITCRGALSFTSMRARLVSYHKTENSMGSYGVGSKEKDFIPPAKGHEPRTPLHCSAANYHHYQTECLCNNPPEQTTIEAAGQAPFIFPSPSFSALMSSVSSNLHNLLPFQWSECHACDAKLDGWMDGWMDLHAHISTVLSWSVREEDGRLNHDSDL